MTASFIITGSRGFIAGALARELKKRHPGARVLLVDHKPVRGHLVCDLTDAAQVSRLILRTRPQAIYHLAGRRSQDRHETLAAHAGSAVNILEAVRALPRPEKTAVLIAGSAAEYGKPAGGAIIEESPARPLTPYGASKLCGTLTALSYRHLGLKVFATRIFNVLGPGMPTHLSLGSFASQIARIENGLQTPLLKTGNLGSRRDYVDVRDLARALADIVEKGRPGELYNVCSGKAVAMHAMLDAMLAFSTRPIKVASRPAGPAENDVPVVFGSPRKLRAHAGWRPRISLERSLQDTLGWHRRVSKLNLKAC